MLLAEPAELAAQYTELYGKMAQVAGSLDVLEVCSRHRSLSGFVRPLAEAILANRLYVLPHQASRVSIQRRFERIDRTFDEQAADGWTH